MYSPDRNVVVLIMKRGMSACAENPTLIVQPLERHYRPVIVSEKEMNTN
jgi:hypothetical protein